MELIASTVNPRRLLVRTGAGEVGCPFPTYLGTIDVETRKIDVWTPAANAPRGHRARAGAVLAELACRDVLRPGPVQAAATEEGRGS